MKTISHLTAIAAILFSGAIFGFFYAWICSTMWGLDAAKPEVAIAAMQAMNASVRNAVFAPIFFGTPCVIAVAAIAAWRVQAQVSGVYFALAASLYFAGALLLTMSVNVPMNDALAATPIPASSEAAQDIWITYSSRWQTYNILRTVVSGGSLLLCALGLLKLGQTTSALKESPQN
ncbi:MAG: DUF1772 domain-containing protein [Pelagimonas sp.]|uniref:anthrone oxygenase family protein n=1 Tax=Pelagimonas sp. TaxID=2073170 RepID=UPI003D6C3DF1